MLANLVSQVLYEVLRADEVEPHQAVLVLVPNGGDQIIASADLRKDPAGYRCGMLLDHLRQLQLPLIVVLVELDKG